jgi:ACT domain-containing protein
VDRFDFLDGVLDAVSLTEVNIVHVHEAIALGPGAKSNIANTKEVENVCSRVEARNIVAISNTNVLFNKSAERSII